MSERLKLVAVSGALQKPSRTETLLEAIVGELSIALPVDVQFIRLSETAPLLGGAISRTTLHPRIFADIQTIEAADALVVATPVYRGSYTGIFKHLFDFLGHEALIDKPVLLAATGGSERHALIIDHQLRPLFAFFQALTLPVGVYASEPDFSEYRLTNPAVSDRIALAVDRALPWLARASGARRGGALRQPFLAQL